MADIDAATMHIRIETYRTRAKVESKWWARRVKRKAAKAIFHMPDGAKVVWRIKTRVREVSI